MNACLQDSMALFSQHLTGMYLDPPTPSPINVLKVGKSSLEGQDALIVLLLDIEI